MPPSKMIANPFAAYGLTGDPTAQWIVDMTNGSGGTLREGDVVICTDVAGLAATTTTTASDPAVVGVVGAGNSGSSGTIANIGTGLAAASNTNTFASLAVMPVVVFGPARVNIASNTVAAKACIASAAVAKTAAVPAAAASVTALQLILGSWFAISGESQAAIDAQNTIRCWIMRA